MAEKNEAQRFADMAPQLSKAELDAINALFPAYIFRRSRTDEIWTTCCQNHLMAGCSDNGLRVPDIDLVEVMRAPNQREPRNSYCPRLKPTVKCPICCRPAIVKELCYTGKRKNLSRYRRAVVFRWYRGVLWARAYDCGKHYIKDGGYSLTGEPKSKLVGVYRFKPGSVEATTRDWFYDGPFTHLWRNDIGLTKGHWNIPNPFSCNAEYGVGYDVIGLEEIQKSPFCYCMVSEANGKTDKLLQFLTACCFYPRQIEMLMKAGMSDVVMDLVERGVKHSAVIDWDESNPARAFKVSRQAFRDFLGTDLDIRILELYKKLKGRATVTECANWMTRGLDIYRVSRAAAKWNIPLEKLIRYLDGNCGCARYGGLENLNTALRYWEDYLTAAEAMNYPLHHENILLPKKLGEAHNDATQQNQRRLERLRSARQRELDQQRIAEQRERDRLMMSDYAKRKVKLDKKYSFALDGYMIRVPESGEEILAEGRKLKHCVGGYADRHMRGTATILFMRKVKTPNTTWLTIEMFGNRLVQIHGFRNEGLFSGKGRFAPDPREVYREFLDTWLAWLEHGSKRDKEGKPILPKARTEVA